MLTDRAEAPAPATPKLTPELTPKLAPEPTPERSRLPPLLRRAMRIEWAGQTAATLCWIPSVFADGRTPRGDWLQRCAAPAWLPANPGGLAPPQGD